MASGTPLFDDAMAWEEAQERLASLVLGDGLPLVVPTERRLARMLAGVAEPERPLGDMAPLFGTLSAASVAYQCVLAGCVPAELPVVLTAALACLEPAFNLLGIQTTTGTPAVAVLVHGPVVEALGINAATNCLGPGNRANACIGRALRLVLMNIGGGRPGIGDMATMGQPGKYTFCFAESSDGPWPPLPARRGLAKGASAVTVLGVSGTMEVLPIAGEATPEAVIAPMVAAMRGAAEAASAGRGREPGELVFLVPPEVAGYFADTGWALRECQDAVFRTAPGLAGTPADVHPLLTGGAGVKMTYLPLWAGGTRSVTRPLLAP